MHWFQGNIAEAVAKSKAMNAVFIVFVEGTDDMSRDLAGVLEASDVAAKLGDQNKFLAVRLSSTDENYTHFAQIYKFVPVPSIFFIGRDGSPLEVVCAGVTADKIVQRIDKILDLHYNKISSADLTSSAPSPGTSTTSAATSASFIQAESSSTHTPAAPSSQNAEDVPSSSASKEEEEYEIVCDGDVCTRRPKQPFEQKTETTPPDAPAAVAIAPSATSAGAVAAEAGAVVAEAAAADAEARIKRTQQLLESKRREKEALEKELEKQRELERRATGQGVAELKRWQREQEILEAAEERRRERQANAEARQRVLEQIAQDRAERLTRHAAPATPPSPPPPPASTATVARLQLKTAAGDSHVATFSPRDRMADVYAYVREHGLAGTSSFTLWTAFPRRALAADDSTLEALGLAPSAALLLLPAEGVAVPAPAASLYSLITTLFSTLIVQPVLGAWSWLSARVFPPPARPSPPPRARPAAAEGLRYRAGSNVHRLREDDDADDDDNNTWNGNSTQQM